MNSIFSSFDFLCAELFGMKVKAHLPPAASTVGGGDPSPLRRGEGAPDIPRTGSKGENVTEQKQKQKQKESFPRFALELDGIHCFETIVPH
ncbi:uncharacterized protein LOC130140008 [Syzygium oleosum]|uniref:uncharacterized protein LOC130140008 n=1 Tax=Syzygium oleosum TaxID=219896 RepID=UPI0024BB21FF|nr:uncharacterized protein LOC130140008 [Syzygium oleosum]